MRLDKTVFDTIKANLCSCAATGKISSTISKQTISYLQFRWFQREFRVCGGQSKASLSTASDGFLAPLLPRACTVLRLTLEREGENALRTIQLFSDSGDFLTTPTHYLDFVRWLLFD